MGGFTVKLSQTRKHVTVDYLLVLYVESGSA